MADENNTEVQATTAAPEAAAPAIVYQIVSFGLVVILVPFLKIRRPDQSAGAPAAPPVVVEA